MSRSLQDTRRWMDEGTKLFHDALAGLDEDGLGAPTLLPGWTRKHLLAHVAANADAVRNLVHWAATGERTPMYSSAGQREADIQAGSRRPAEELLRWSEASAARLSAAMDRLTQSAWTVEVVTAQGRQVPASETPWMRAREVMVHAVDLGTGVSFTDLPDGFLHALVEDVLARRGRDTDVLGSLPARAAYLTGRADGETAGVRTPDGAPAPDLPPWL